MQKNAAILVLPGEEDTKKLMKRGGVDVDWMMSNGTVKKVNQFTEVKPEQLRGDGLALPTLYLHTLESKFMCQEGEYNLSMRSGNDNSELILVFPEEFLRQELLGLDDEAKAAFSTVLAFLHGQGEVMVSEIKSDGGKHKAKFNRHRLNFKLKTSRPKAGISLPKQLFGIPEEASVYLFVENHTSVNFMTKGDKEAIEACIGIFSENVEDKQKMGIATFLKVFFEGGFAYNKKQACSGGYIPINASICCLGLVPGFNGQIGIGTGFPYQLKSTHLPFVDTVPVSIGAIADMSDRHKRYGLCFTRCVHVWEGADFNETGMLNYCAILPHGGFFYVPDTLEKHTELGGLVYAFGESTDASAEAANESASGAGEEPPVDTIQICFVMDCTGSMGNWIAEAKRSVISMVDGITEEAAGLKVEMSFVCYRDFDSGKDNIVSRDFTTNIGEIKDFAGTLKAQGGDDAPEDMAGGLKAAMGQTWLDGAKKFLVIVADAPCHGRQFHSLSDRHPDGGISGMPDAHLAKMKDNNIQLIFVKINNTTDKMIEEFKKIYEGGEKKLTVADLSTGGTAAFKAAITQEVVANLG